jgi:COMPASS component SWD2
VGSQRQIRLHSLLAEEKIQRESFILGWKMAEAWNPNSLEAGAIILGDSGVNSLDFHREGRYLLMTTKDCAVHLVDSLAGVEKKKLLTRRDKIGQAKYTHSEACVLLTSEQPRDRRCNDIRYLCLHDNRYLRYFKGHADKVTSIAMSPIEDNFLSASSDKSVMLWNINTPTPVAKLQLPGNVQNPYVRYDGTGLVFGVQVQDEKTLLHSIKLFDARAYDNGPFQDIVPDYPLLCSAVQKGMAVAGNESPTRPALSAMLNTTWSGFEFSPDGLHLLVNTTTDLMLVIDGFKEDTEPVAICARKNDTGYTLGACFSADAKYVIAGNEAMEVQIFEKSTGRLVNTLSGHADAVTCVAANPVYDVIASGCINTVLWIHPADGAAMEN